MTITIKKAHFTQATLYKSLGTLVPQHPEYIFFLSQREEWQELQHPVTNGSLYDHTRKSASSITGMEVLVKKFGIKKNPAYNGQSLANLREVKEPYRKFAKVQRWNNWYDESHGGKGDMRA